MTLSLLFDLDGTLSDPKPGITRCIQHALRALGRDAPEEDELCWCIGPPLRQSFLTLLDDGSEENADRALALYRERFGEIGLYENELHDHIPEVLAAQKRRGRRLFVASAKPIVYVIPILEHLGLAPYFDGAYGSELDGTRGDKRELLEHLMAAEGIDAAGSVMIGDRHHDIEAARAVGAASVWVEWGYGDTAERDEARPDHVCATPGRLDALLASL